MCPQHTRMAISLQRVIRSTSCLVLGWGFGDGESNGAIYGSNKSKMAATDMLEKFQMAISPQPVVRSTSCFVLGWGFRGRRSVFPSHSHNSAQVAKHILEILSPSASFIKIDCAGGHEIHLRQFAFLSLVSELTDVGHTVTSFQLN